MSISNNRIITQWEHHIHVHASTFDKAIECHSTRFELFYFNENFRRIALWGSA